MNNTELTQLQIELVRILCANSARPNTKKARMLEHFFLLGYLFRRTDVPKTVHNAVMSGTSILTLKAKTTIPVTWNAKME